MKKRLKITLAVLLPLASIALGAWYISTHNIEVLNPKGMIGMKEREVLTIATLLMLIVVIPVLILTLAFPWKYRAGNLLAKYSPNWDRSPIAESLWWGIPLAIIAIMAAIVWKSSHELNPFKPIETDKKPLTIQVVALDWKWLFLYPEQGIASVNFIQFPEKTPINFEITADAPMNSFWIPQLGGQIYAMPAMRSRLHLIANEKGRFRGSSANISGKGFAGMTFTAESTSQEDFDHWVAYIQQSLNYLGFEDYEQLAKPSEYDPVAFYLLAQDDLFDRIVEKYRTPPEP
ncbi:MAG: ubiquinol oxidase subunit II [Waddliaceae bacterium]